jgi:hypothetical protein
MRRRRHCGATPHASNAATSAAREALIMKRTKLIQPTAIAQMIRTDARETPAAVAALEQMQKTRPLKPPGKGENVAKRAG